MNVMKNIASKINRLTPGMIEELDRYLDYLIDKRISKKPRKLKQDWAGGLKGIKMTSIELQKKALENFMLL